MLDLCRALRYAKNSQPIALKHPSTMDERLADMQKFNDAGTKRRMNRRSFLGVTGAVAVATVAGGHAVSAAAERGTQVRMIGRRKLGSLEVSSVGRFCRTALSCHQSSENVVF